MAAMQLTRTHRILIGVVIFGAVIIAAIGFAGSYAAVRELAEAKGFGNFSLVFPIGIDAGICVLLALDLLLTWLRIPFPLLRQSAWLLTAATIAFNGAAAWPDPLGVGMHAVIPILFIVSVEAARHAVGRIADITADKHMEGVRLTRWLLSPVPTFKLWRRMKLWELRSYEQVIKLEQDRLIYQSRLQARFGRNWRRKAPVEALMPLRLAKYGVPLADTAPSGLAAAGIEPVLLPPAPPMAELTRAREEKAAAESRYAELVQRGRERQRQEQALEEEQPSPSPSQQERPEPREQPRSPYQKQPQSPQSPLPPQSPQSPQEQPDGQRAPGPEGLQRDEAQAPHDQPLPGAAAGAGPQAQVSPWFAAPQVPTTAYEGAYNPTYVEGLEPTPVMIPSGPGRSRPLGGMVPGQRTESPYPAQAQEQEQEQTQPQPRAQTHGQGQGQEPAESQSEGGPQPSAPAPAPEEPEELPILTLPDGISNDDAYFDAFRAYVVQHGDFPNSRKFALYLMDLYGVKGNNDGPLSEGVLRPYMKEFRYRYQSEVAEVDSEQIA
ncbi:hypothetical protein GCM10009654_04810 [Streptomyces hebeiensis]|uniref:DUF2637 domain-containing protein n=1 Tax=Streptomyces hebeiensis TaxID=229486 RepID=A0ABN1UIG1_9ACTN